MTTFSDLHRSDFNFGFGASLADLFWRTDAGQNAIFLMNNNTATTIAAMPFVTPDWHYIGSSDFDSAGGNADILWQNNNGSLALWQMNGTTISNIVALPTVDPSWRAVAQNDFNLDGSSDIFFRNDNGSVAIWTFTSATVAPFVFSGTQNPGAAWHVVGSGDTNGDARAGILWQHDSGALAIWEDVFGAGVNAFAFSTIAALPTVDTTWHVKGMGDMNADGRSDIIFQHDTGAVVVWEMAAGGTTVASVNLAALNPGPDWDVVGIRNMNNDGRDDILFQHVSGTAAVWENYVSGGGVANFSVQAITPNPNPSGLVWDLL